MESKMEHFSFLCLFFLYALLSVLCLLLVTSGAGVYKSILDRSLKIHSTTTALEYVFNKLKAHPDGVHIVNEQKILLEQNVNDKEFYTLIYEKDGSLYEYTGIENTSDPIIADKICGVESFFVSETSKGYWIEANGQSLFAARE